MSARQLAFFALKDIYHRKAYTDVALDRVLQKNELKSVDRGLLSELIYGIVRRRRTLDTLINQLAKKNPTQQPPNLRIILQIGLYQLRYLDQIPPSAAVNTTVELARNNRLSKLTGVVNGVLRNYLRQAKNKDPLILPTDSITRLGLLHSFPDWIINIFHSQLDESETAQLCTWYNQPATIDLRINPLQTTLEGVKNKLLATGMQVNSMPLLPQALRLTGRVGNIKKLPGFTDGWYSVQDCSAQLVTHFLNPQPEETIIDVCAAPGGKTTHIAELMGDRGTIIACDRSSSRAQKIQQNALRLKLRALKIEVIDGSKSNKFNHQGDKVLVDAPCSGLGTLHKRPDIRWRQNRDQIEELIQLQAKILQNAASWVKLGGKLVYATCTLNPSENEAVIRNFLKTNPHWHIESPPDYFKENLSVTSEGMIKIFPHRHQMDGFFMVKLSSQ